MNSELKPQLNSAVVAKPVVKKKKKGIQKVLSDFWASRYLQLLILPGLAYYIIFCYIPMYGVIIAFKDYRLVDGIMGSEWVGFQHFIDFFENPWCWQLIRNTFLLNFYNLLFAFPLPIIFALLLNEVRSVRYRKFIQTVSYLPHFISTVAICGMVVMFLSPSIGIVNRVITALGGEAIYFMIEPRWFRTIYIASDLWTDLGWGAIIYIAALSNVEQQLYEAAYIDGANRIQMMWRISLPSIKNTIVVLLILRIDR